MVRFGPHGLRAYCVTFLNEKWMGGEMKLRGVERATAEAVDMIPPPHLTTPSYQQHPAPSSLQTKQARVRILRGKGDKGR